MHAGLMPPLFLHDAVRAASRAIVLGSPMRDLIANATGRQLRPHDTCCAVWPSCNMERRQGAERRSVHIRALLTVRWPSAARVSVSPRARSCEQRPGQEQRCPGLECKCVVTVVDPSVRNTAACMIELWYRRHVRLDRQGHHAVLHECHCEGSSRRIVGLQNHADARSSAFVSLRIVRRQSGW